MSLYRKDYIVKGWIITDDQVKKLEQYSESEFWFFNDDLYQITLLSDQSGYNKNVFGICYNVSESFDYIDVGETISKDPYPSICYDELSKMVFDEIIEPKILLFSFYN